MGGVGGTGSNWSELFDGDVEVVAVAIDIDVEFEIDRLCTVVSCKLLDVDRKLRDVVIILTSAGFNVLWCGVSPKYGHVHGGGTRSRVSFLFNWFLNFSLFLFLYSFSLGNPSLGLSMFVNTRGNELKRLRWWFVGVSGWLRSAFHVAWDARRFLSLMQGEEGALLKKVFIWD